MKTIKKSLFSVPVKFEKDFDTGIISDELRNIFKINNISKNASIYKYSIGWELIDKGKDYFIKRENGKLNIYKGLSTKGSTKTVRFLILCSYLIVPVVMVYLGKVLFGLPGILFGAFVAIIITGLLTKYFI
ncbi:MAG: hypothetical protein KAI55_01105 [Candidatus Aenigmarchaeota archaeon]|nr:hypothetical protein [Candidatus Aenigmarchaeota archaeon]